MGYVDASFDTDPDDSRSQTGYVFKVNGGAVSWKSCKQPVVAQSTMEAEYVAAAEAANDAVWLRKYVKQLGVFPSARGPVTILCDNTGAIANAKELRNHSTAKHMLRRFHVVREYVSKKRINVCKVHTDLNVADPLTKALPQDKHDQHRESMGVRLLPDVN
jgi:hypothetical protein